MESFTPSGRTRPARAAKAREPAHTATGTSSTWKPAVLMSASRVPCLPMSMPTMKRSR
ncbi:Uncharacterised protein [Flavonifractor plautii]|uniref:Uncharacterized protein n=1 Tax=Flavonifractor plautii TaxID=292800 RepID=A0A174MPH7_FLAPL|nr:Uncharacterised protein [Flavonifractor plautii]